MRRIAVALLAVCVSLSGAAPVALGLPPPDAEGTVKVNAVWRTPKAHAGDQVVLAVVVEVAQGWHINADPAQKQDIGSFKPIPTEVKISSSSIGLRIGAPQFPTARELRVEFADQPIKVFEGNVVVYVPALVEAKALPGSVTVKGTVAYQACDERTCLPPDTVAFEAQLTIVEPGIDPGPPQSEGLFKAFDPSVFADLAGAARAPATAPAGVESGAANLDFFGYRFEVAGLALLLLIAVVVGVLLNFTPCVLPVVPLKILSLQRHAGHPRRALALGLSFSAGIVTSFVLLGLLTAGLVKTLGQLGWGEQFSYWQFNLALGLIMGVMALGLIGVFTTRLPGFVYRITPNQDTHAGSLLMGVLTAVLSTPCTGPMMGGTMAWAAQQAPWKGLCIFAAMGVGMAAPYLALVANPKWVDRLPRAGPGSVLMKEVMGTLLLAVAVYFLGIAGRAAGWWGTQYWWAVQNVVVLGMGWMVYRTIVVARHRATVVTVLVFGVALTALSFRVAGSLGGASDGSAASAGGGSLAERGAWRPFTPAALAKARTDGQTVVLEFTADWCLNCKALELAVLNDAQVQQRLADPRVTALRVDLTGKGNKAGWDMLSSLGSKGVPLTAVYRRGKAEPRLFSSFYTKTALLDALDGN